MIPQSKWGRTPEFERSTSKKNFCTLRLKVSLIFAHNRMAHTLKMVLYRRVFLKWSKTSGAQRRITVRRICTILCASFGANNFVISFQVPDLWRHNWPWLVQPPAGSIENFDIFMINEPRRIAGVFMPKYCLDPDHRWRHEFKRHHLYGNDVISDVKNSRYTAKLLLPITHDKTEI